MAREEVKLFKSLSSPYGWRVVWALKLKGIEYEVIDEDLANKSPQLLQYNPIHKKIPLLVHNDNPIAESLVILEYVDETWKQYPILPQDPHERAAARFWAKFGDAKVLPSIWGSFTKQGKEQEEMFEEAMGNLKCLEEQLVGKKFFGGEKIGCVDLAVGWLGYWVPILEEILGMKLIGKEKFPLLSVWMENFSNFPIIKDNLPPREEMISTYKAYQKKYHSLAVKN
ncbi:Glutathione S-transferase, N-terminal [Dillenia turbinata]|uniref:glutathione transferase n=1 Tax=Dillenia turbinata TaxID=194707 RepID=A0AAN8V1T3_9MAGN